MLSWFDFSLAIPEMIVLIVALLALMLDLFFGDKCKKIAYATVQIGLIIAAIVTIYNLPSQAEFGFANSFVLDRFAAVIKFFIEITSIVVFFYGRRYVADRHLPQGEYYVLGLISVLGMMVLVSANNLLLVYIGVELMSLPIYAMVALWRERTRCVEAAMKYFVMGAIASGLLLYGLSLLFGITGSLSFASMSQALSAATTTPLLLVFAVIFILAGLIFKLGGAPFHVWVPDVYEGAPTSVTLLISTAPKLAAFAILARFLDSSLFGMIHEWHQLLIVIAIASMAIGNWVALTQQNLKRMLAYSSIAHIGYMTLGLVAGDAAGFSASLFYMISYTLTALGAFGVLVLLSQAGVEVETLADCRGLSQRHPWFAFTFLLILFSLAGIPPLVGFMAKVGVLEALIGTGQTTLAVIAIIFAVIGVYYYLRVVKVMYFEAPENQTLPDAKPGLAESWVIGINGLAVLVLGVFPSGLFALCHSLF